MAAKKKQFGATVAEHMAKKHPDDPIEKRRYHTLLPCRISADDAEKRGLELAKSCRERDEWTEQRAEENRKARERRAFLDERIQELRIEVEQCVQSRSVECIDELVPRSKMIRTRRLDTNEIVREREASANELQIGMPGIGDPATPSAGAPKGGLKKKRGAKGANDVGEFPGEPALEMSE